LLEVVGLSGPIYVYNQGFEEGRVKELAAKHKDLAAALEALADRFFDLLPLTRDHYYHPAMKGSWSIKSVLPTIDPELDYSKLAGTKDGGQAQIDYLKIIDPKTDSTRREELKNGLLAYCMRDTEAMVKLTERLSNAQR
jgi:hypothetical protein